MTLHTLAEIAAKLGRLDGIDDDNHAQYEKGLRNLVQRHFLPPTTQQGRVFLYDPAAAVTIRLAQIAAEFGITRTSIDTLTRWLSGVGERRISHAAEAIQRHEAGEVFSLHIVMRADRSVIVRADWTDERPRSERADNALRLLHGPDIAAFSLPASYVIAEILPSLNEG